MTTNMYRSTISHMYIVFISQHFPVFKATSGAGQDPHSAGRRSPSAVPVSWAPRLRARARGRSCRRPEPMEADVDRCQKNIIIYNIYIYMLLIYYVLCYIIDILLIYYWYIIDISSVKLYIMNMLWTYHNLFHCQCFLLYNHISLTIYTYIVIYPQDYMIWTLFIICNEFLSS